jgi:hypothetical protein
MAFCNEPTHPVHMSPEERMEEIASILAAGFLRLRRRGGVPLSCSPPQILSDSPPNGLEVSGETRLHGHRG